MQKPIDSSAASAMVVLCAVWGTQQVAIKLAASDMAPVFQVGLRSGAAALLVFLVMVFRRELPNVQDRTWRSGLAVGVLFGMEFVLFAKGLEFTSASHMSIFLYTAPIFAALGLHLKHAEERLAPLQWLGIAIAFGGIVVTFAGRNNVPATDFSWLGDVLGIAAGVFWGATTIVVRSSTLARAPATVTLWYQLIGASVIGLITAWGLGQIQVTLTPLLAASLAYQTIILSAASYLIWFSLLRNYLASRLSVLTLITPVFGIGFGIAILGDTLTREFLCGSALILIGILLVNGHDVFSRRATKAIIST